VAPSPGDNLVFPAGAAQMENYNDYPSGTVFGSITVSGSGYHFQNNDSSSTSLQVQTGGQLEADNIVTETLTIGAGATVTITPIAGGPLAANSTLTILAAPALRPTLLKPIAQPTTADTIATSASTAITTVAPGPLAVSTVLATPVPASIEAASAFASSDSSSNTVLDVVTQPTAIIADIALPVGLVESTSARLIDTAINRLPSQSPIYSWLDSTALNKIIEGDLQQSLTTRIGNTTSTAITDSLSDELPSHVSKFTRHSTTPAINIRQAHIAALETIVQNSRWSYLDTEADFDIGRHIRAGKHSNQFEKAIDKVLAEEEDAIPALL